MKLGVPLIVALIATPMLAASAPPPLAIAFKSEGVDITGVTPRAMVYVYSLTREPKGWKTSIVSRETRLRDDDGDGRVTWDLKQPLSWRSVWFAVDLESGSFGTATPPAYLGATRFDLTGTHLKKDAGGEVMQLAVEGSMVEVVAVRPKKGDVWGATVLSRAANDAGTEAGRVTLSMLRLAPRAGTTEPAPKGLKNDDVIFVLNSFRGAYAAARVGEE